MSDIVNVSQSTVDKIKSDVKKQGDNKIREALGSFAIQEFIRRRVCEIANKIITSNPEWKKVRKDEYGNMIEHRFTSNTNWAIEVNQEQLFFECKNITPPSDSIFSSEKFGLGDAYNYDRTKDVFDGAALSVWIDEGRWIDLTKLFEEMGRANGKGKVMPDSKSLQRKAIPFLEQSFKEIINDNKIKEAIISFANR